MTLPIKLVSDFNDRLELRHGDDGGVAEDGEQGAEEDVRVQCLSSDERRSISIRLGTE